MKTKYKVEINEDKINIIRCNNLLNKYMTLQYNCQTTNKQRTTLIYKQWLYKIKTNFKLSLTPVPMPNNISVAISTFENYNDN